MERSSELQTVLREAYDKYRLELGNDAISDMAYPSYLFGNPLSRYVFWKKLELIIRAAAPRDNASVLDFGCGSGILLPTLSKKFRKVFATDLRPAPALFLVERLGLAGIQFVPVNTWSDSIADHSLDVIIVANVLEHVGDRIALLEQFASKLTPTGRLVISGPTENSLYKLGRKVVGFSGEYHVATVKDVLDDACSVGFNEEQRFNWPLPGFLCLYQIAGYSPA